MWNSMASLWRMASLILLLGAIGASGAAPRSLLGLAAERGTRRKMGLGLASRGIKRNGDWRGPQSRAWIPLTLKGGEGKDESSSNDTEPTEKLPEYTGEEDRERGLPACDDGVFALDACELCMLPSDAGANSWRGEGFRPLFAHQIFGQEEEIVGYKRPRVVVTYAADTLLPSIRFEHDGVTRSSNRTEVIKSIKAAAPSDYINATRLPGHVAATAGIFRPPGHKVSDYTLFELGGTEADIDKAADECGARTVRYETYLVGCGEEQGEAALKLVRRTQSLAMWLIEEASYIDTADPNWSCMMTYERVEGALAGGHPSFHLVAFTTLYRRGLKGLNEKELIELTPLKEEIAEREDVLCRLSISQFVVLPPYSRRGHGTKLIRTVYREARADSGVLDVTAESPNEAFLGMRLGADAAELRDVGLMQAIKGRDPPWGAVHKKTKLSMVQLFSLAESIGCEAGRAGVRHVEGEREGATEEDEDDKPTEEEKEEATEKEEVKVVPIKVEHEVKVKPRIRKEDAWRAKEEEDRNRSEEAAAEKAKNTQVVEVEGTPVAGRPSRPYEEADEKPVPASKSLAAARQESSSQSSDSKGSPSGGTPVKASPVSSGSLGGGEGKKGRAFPTLFGVEVDLEHVYGKAKVLPNPKPQTPGLKSRAPNSKPETSTPKLNRLWVSPGRRSMTLCMR